MKIRVYISANEDLPNLEVCLKYLIKKLQISSLSYDDIYIVSDEPSKFEYPALNKIWLDSQFTDFYGLYLHTKGASKQDALALANALSWADYMLYGLLDNYEVCLDHMEKGADLVGSMWYRHFKGNFFWFKSSYVKNLRSPSKAGTSTRINAEYWCSGYYWSDNQAPQPKVKNLYYLPIANDGDFINLKNNKYIPNLNKKEINYNIAEVVEKNHYSVFDEIHVNCEQFKNYENVLSNYMNYDSKIIHV